MNIYNVVLEFAKQELIQKPYIMVCSWSKFMHKLRSFPEFCCFDAVHQYYSSANPTNKVVISLLDVEPKSDAERDFFFSILYFTSIIIVCNSYTVQNNMLIKIDGYGCSNVAKLFEKIYIFLRKKYYDFYKNSIFLSKNLFFFK